MEYLASGVPVIAKRLTGMDSEYSDFFIEFSDKRSLEEVMKKLNYDEKKINLISMELKVGILLERIKHVNDRQENYLN